MGRRISTAEVLHPRAARHQPGGAREIEALLRGRVVTAARRRGKFLWLTLDDADAALLVHLGMSGQMLIKSADADPSRHLRARLDLDGGSQVWFVDQRTFGYWWYGDLVDGVPARVAHIAPDLLSTEADLPTVVRTLRARSTEIKRLLLSQEIISGIGNIYADEMLWEAQIHPRQRADRVSAARLLALLEAGRTVMARALEQGGTSFDSLYVNVNGDSGYFALSLNAYGQQDEPCARCGTPIVREQFMNRSSHFCPNCQRRR